MSEQIVMAISPKNKKPMCPLLAAVYGTPCDKMLLAHFDHWQIGPADDWKLVSGTAEQWKALAAEWNRNAAELEKKP